MESDILGVVIKIFFAALCAASSALFFRSFVRNYKRLKKGESVLFPGGDIDLKARGMLGHSYNFVFELISALILFYLAGRFCGVFPEFF